VTDIVVCGFRQQVQQAIDKAADPKLQIILQQLRGYSNIPRKKAKFEVCLTVLPLYIVFF